jgi:hypothetical protein
MSPSSSQFDDDAESINPYAPSQISDEPVPAAPVNREEPHREYHVHMDWADRRRFLRSVGPMRVASAIGALLWTMSLLAIIRASFLWTSEMGLDSAMVIPMALSVAECLVALYSWWLYWRLADAFVATAGGTTSSLCDWSHLEFRLAWVVAAWMALYGISRIMRWLLERLSGSGLDTLNRNLSENRFYG